MLLAAEVVRDLVYLSERQWRLLLCLSFINCSRYTVSGMCMLRECCVNAAWMLRECCVNAAWMLRGCCVDLACAACVLRASRVMRVVW